MRNEILKFTDEAKVIYKSKFLSNPGFDAPDRFITSFDFRTEYFKVYFALPSQTNYVTETFFTPGYTHQDSATIDVLSKSILMQANFFPEENFINWSEKKEELTEVVLSLMLWQDHWASFLIVIHIS